jgi:primosomal protein N' (replication factor Y) (superfamily II helicase)
MTSEMTKKNLWQVAVPVPLRRTFIYDIPHSLGESVAGMRVLVPFGHRRLTGLLICEATDTGPTKYAIKSAIEIIDKAPVLEPELLRFTQEAASYYAHPVGEVVRSALPPGIDYTERKGTLRKPRIKRHTERLLKPLGGAEEAIGEVSKRAPKRGDLLATVVAAGEIRLADLRKRYKTATSLAKRLADDGLISIEEQEKQSDPFANSAIEPDEPFDLTDEQSVATEALFEAIDKGTYRGFLLHGITGSGKTEVYLRAIARTHDRGQGALVLVPEIALTPQLVRRYRARFGDGLAVWHSGLTDRERYDQWRRLLKGEVRVAIGVRSAVFAPVRNLGIIIVDEEHDSSFKQERGFHYHARDMALLRAARTNAVALLGSATPSLESAYNAHNGKLDLLTLRQRATNQPLPEVGIIDLKLHHSGPGGQKIITLPLFEAINQTLERREQVILFLNRRGFAPALLCTDCGELLKCDACAVSLTFHRRPVGLVCHYCGIRRPIPERCPNCASGELKPVGTGTQKVEEILAQLFPRARVARLDRDSASGSKVEAILDLLRNDEIDILVGTQMVTKGHDFPRVTLVGVLSADVGLHMPDFRASERTFQLLTQVAGRAGRSERGGRALIQTYSADHPAIDFARTHDFDSFSKVEAQARRELGYPPYGRLAALRLDSLDSDKVESAARRIFVTLQEIRSAQGQDNVDLLGPVPAPIEFVKGRYRWRILLRAPRQDSIRRLLEPIFVDIESPPKNVRIQLDIDPVSML